MQNQLTREQIVAFDHDEFVDDQVRHFSSLVHPIVSFNATVVDVGGGRGYFASGVTAATGRQVIVIDTDAESVRACVARGVRAQEGNALQPNVEASSAVVCFNLVLHHLVADTERETRRLQTAALRAWRSRSACVFVNEYIYESFFGHLSGKLIYLITQSAILSALARIGSRWVPALKANTLGVGVRFRSDKEWRRLFSDAGYRVAASEKGRDEPISKVWRLLLIKRIARDSYCLSHDD